MKKEKQPRRTHRVFAEISRSLRIIILQQTNDALPRLERPVDRARYPFGISKHGPTDGPVSHYFRVRIEESAVIYFYFFFFFSRARYDDHQAVAILYVNTTCIFLPSNEVVFKTSCAAVYERTNTRRATPTTETNRNFCPRVYCRRALGVCRTPHIRAGQLPNKTITARNNNLLLKTTKRRLFPRKPTRVYGHDDVVKSDGSGAQNRELAVKIRHGLRWFTHALFYARFCFSNRRRTSVQLNFTSF